MADAVSNETILVVERKKLFGDNDKHAFQGFQKAGAVDYEQIILDNLKWMNRFGVDGAEGNASFKQPISYCLVVNPYIKKAFAYLRAKKVDDYKEARLQGKLSLGVGGHINPPDVEGNPIENARERELGEEINLNKNHPVNAGKIPYHATRVFGYLNDDSNDVGKDHLGLVYLIETNSNLITPGKDPEIDRNWSGLKDISEIIEMCSDPKTKVENWSKLLLDPLKDYFDSLQAC
jgi:predicted NUDIX family phosphoesterase